jgi:Sulfotransferase domain
MRSALVMDIAAGDDWEKLCPFLGLPIPEVGFPHANASPDLTRWMEQRHLAAQEIEHLVPVGQTFILVDRHRFGDGIGRRRRMVRFFEREGRGWESPSDDAAALRELERLRRVGATFVVFGWPAFWWLDSYPALHRHLRSNGRCVLENERLLVFDLRP